MKIFSISLILPIIIPSSAAFGQWFDKIQTESDWEFFFRDGFYDYNTYQLFRTLAEDSDIADTTEYILSTMGISSTELTEFPEYAPHYKALSQNDDKSRRPPHRIKIGRKILENENSGYVAFSRIHDNIALGIKMRDEEGVWRAERRSFFFKRGGYDLTVGDYTVVAGCGLGIGRFDYRPISFEPRLDRGEDLIFPDNSYYNGLKAGSGNLEFLYSIKKYRDVRKNFIGGYGSKIISRFRIGLTAGTTILASRSNSRSLGAASLFIEEKEQSWQAETGYGESGAGFCGVLHGDRYQIKVWRYAASFVNLQSSGYAHPDYMTFSDDRFELSFRQPQQGETGLFYSRRIKILDGIVTGTAEIWKRSASREMKMENSIYGRWEAARSILLSGGIHDRRGGENERTLFDSGASFRSILEIGVRGFLWIADGAVEKDKSEYYIFAGIPLNHGAALKSRVRRDLSGRLDYFIEQKSDIGRDYRMTATYRWSEEYETDPGPFYVTVEKLW